MEKKCFKCNIFKTLEEFYKHPDMPDGRVNKCKECNKKENKINWHNKREDKLDYDRKRHRYSISRIFNHRYYCIKRRCEKGGRNGSKCFVTGKKYLSKEEWLEWCYQDNNYKKFIEIYSNWVSNDFGKRLSPSIDRVNNKVGYIKDNLQWLTQSDNCKKYNK